MTRRLAALLVLALLAPAPAIAGPDRAASRIRSILAAPDAVPAGRYGIHVSDAATGESLFTADGETTRIPASVMKIVTTSAAFRELGPDFRFRTRVLARAGPGADGALAGDLVVEGGGDPSLSVALGPADEPGALDRLARDVARAGVRRIEGDLVLDDARFDRVLRHDSWPGNQLDRAYCAPVTALLVARSCVTVRVRPGAAVGDPAVVTLRPATGSLRVLNRVKTTATKAKHKIILSVDRAKGTVLAKGLAWVKSTGYEAELAVPDPTPYLGDVFRTCLVRAGVSLRGEVRCARGAAASLENPVVLATHATPLMDVLEVTNRESQNLYAECLLKTLGVEKAGEGSFGAGAAVTTSLAERSGVGKGQLSQADGSGLSRENLVSPLALTTLLDAVFDTADPLAYLRTLAVPGDEAGTLRRRMKDLGGAVRAKTGTINRVSALAGYVRGRQGRVVSFACLVNHPDIARARRLQDALCRILYEEF